MRENQDLFDIFRNVHEIWYTPTIESIDIERNMQALQKTQGIGSLKA